MEGSLGKAGIEREGFRREDYAGHKILKVRVVYVLVGIAKSQII